VADFRDPWARAPWREDRFAFERRAWSILERAVVTRADASVFVTDTNRRDFAKCYAKPLAARFHLVPNGCDVKDFGDLEARPHDSTGQFVLLHAGSLYGARNPAPLLRALHRAIARGAIERRLIRLRFVGRVGVAGLQSVVRELGLDDVVEFVGQMPRQAVLQEMRDASALLIVQPITTVSIPAKLYEYMAAGRPIFALAEPGGETATVIESNKAGISVPAGDEAAIEQALVTLVANRRQVFTPVNRAAYDGQIRADQLGGILADVARQAATSVATPGVSVRRVDSARTNEVSQS
jgi:glycosyltransferase involved in cell wall biosynthesis